VLARYLAGFFLRKLLEPIDIGGAMDQTLIQLLSFVGDGGVIFLLIFAWRLDRRLLGIEFTLQAHAHRLDVIEADG